MAIVSDQDNNSTLGRVVHPRGSKKGAVAAVASASGASVAVAASNNDNSGKNYQRIDHDLSKFLLEDSTDCANMEYAWLEPRHDPIATDTNLAEIDFENFKNEDLAYAFSCGVSSILF